MILSHDFDFFFKSPEFERFSVGFDRWVGIFQDVNKHIQPTFPPHNLVKVSDDKYQLEFALAGFSKGDVEVKQENHPHRVLIVKSKEAMKDDKRTFVHKGIAERSFEKRFTLDEHIQVNGCHMEDGILTVTLERKIPEDQKPVTFDIS